ncbi:hypothetical protein [Leptospira terpstrae]|uniref:hypothetical protein n=1 Tax=Leptospira terpstrae TaxID=293075 RepID=UPI000587986C|nr:hypothetical protein [Leptospira terpstrae]
MEFLTFNKIIFSIINQLDYVLIDLKEAKYSRNFHIAKIKKNKSSDAEIYLICSIFGDIAFSEKYIENSWDFIFIDCIEIAIFLRNIYNISVLTRNELNGLFIERSYISSKDVDYWKPENLGKGLFNYWD